MLNEEKHTALLVSVLIPVKNGATFLREALDSCINQQTNFDFEILVIDDHSTDDTLKIIEEYQLKYPFIRKLENIGIGVGRALQNGLLSTQGEIIMRLDADDRMLPHRMQKQVDILLNDSTLVLCGTQIQLFGKSKLSIQPTIYPISHSEICRFLQCGNAFADPAVAFRREAALQVGGFSKILDGAEQYSLWLRMSKVGKMVNSPEILTQYRIHENQFTQSRNLRVIIATVVVQLLWGFGITQTYLRFKFGIYAGWRTGVGRWRIFMYLPRYLIHIVIAWLRK
jgi:glycosyltransferase involved in cell wall biosynthesis